MVWKMHLQLPNQLDGDVDIYLHRFFLFLLLGRKYIVFLKEMGGCFALIGKYSKRKPLYKDQKFYLEDIELSEVLTINQNYVKSYYK